MDKEELRNLIRQTKDEKILDALWELYDRKNTVTVEKIIYKEIQTYPTFPVYPTRLNEPYYDTKTWEPYCGY